MFRFIVGVSLVLVLGASGPSCAADMTFLQYLSSLGVLSTSSSSDSFLTLSGSAAKRTPKTVLFDSPIFTGTVKLPITGVSQCLQVNSLGYIAGTGAECGSGTGGVTSFFGRTGAVVANLGDYSVGQITGAAPLASPAFTGTVTLPVTGPGNQCLHVDANGVLSGTGGECGSSSGGLVNTVFGRSGAVTAQSGDYDVSQVTGAASAASPTFSGTVTLPITGSTQCLRVNSSGVLAGSGADCGTSSVPSVFGRTGAVTAQSGDYTVAQITGAAPAASPTFTGTVTLPARTVLSTPAVTTYLVDGHTNNQTLTVADVSRSTVHNYGQSGDVLVNLPAAASGYAFIAYAAQGSVNAWRFKSNGTDAIYLDGQVAANRIVKNASPALLDSLSCMTLWTGGSTYVWSCRTSMGIWVTE